MQKLWDTFTVGNLITIGLLVFSVIVFGLEQRAETEANARALDVTNVQVEHNRKAIERLLEERGRMQALEVDVRYIRDTMEKLERRLEGR